MNLAEQSRDLVLLRNPFKTSDGKPMDFTITYDVGHEAPYVNGQPNPRYFSKTVTLPADAQWHPFVKALADVIVDHLSQKILMQLHDAEVSRLKGTAGGREAAIKYRIPQDVKDRVMFLITGKMTGSLSPTQEAGVDLGILNPNEVKQYEALVAGNGAVGKTMDVKDLVDAANMGALMGEQHGMANLGQPAAPKLSLVEENASVTGELQQDLSEAAVDPSSPIAPETTEAEAPAGQVEAPQEVAAEQPFPALQTLG